MGWRKNQRAPIAKRQRRFGHRLIFSAAIFTVLLPTTMARAMPDWAKKTIDSVGQTSPDPGASAWILHRSMDVSLTGDGTTRSHIRLLVKVLTTSGARFAVVAEGVYPLREVKSLKGWIRRADGSSDDMDLRDCIYLAEKAAAGYYDDQRLLVAELPRIDPGCVVAFDYEVVEESWFNPYVGIYFQRQEPVRYVSLSVYVAEGWRLDYRLNNGDDVTLKQDGDRYVWSAQNLGYRKPEPLMPDWGEVSPHVAVVCSRADAAGASSTSDDSTESAAQGWKSIGRQVSQLMLDAARYDSTIEKLAGLLTDTIQSPELKAGAIGRYVRDNVRYVAVEIGRGRIRPRPASLTLRNLYGDCKDKTALTRSLLAAAGLPSVSVLARAEGEVQPQLPAGSQFNHCIVAIPASALGLADTAYVDARASTWLFFDPTAEHVQFGHLPSQLAGTFVLVCSDTVPQLVRLPESRQPATQRRFLVRAELNVSGELLAVVDVTESYPGYTQAALARRNDERARVEASWRKVVQEWLPGGELSDLQSTEWDDSSHIHFELKATGYAGLLGSNRLIRLIPVLDPRPPELSAPGRTYPVQFGESKLDEFDVRWTWPAALRPTTLPDAITDSCALGLVHGMVEADGSGLRVRVRRAYSEAQLEVDQYATAQAFDRCLSAVASLRIVLGTMPDDR